MDIEGLRIEILPFSAYTKYLGRKLTFDDQSTTELQSRLGAAWGKFNSLRHELTSKTYPLKDRLRLFDGTVTATALYGCASWTLTRDLETKLRCTQRRMLRLIVGTKRRKTCNQAGLHDNSDNTRCETSLSEERAAEDSQPQQQPAQRPEPPQRRQQPENSQDDTSDDDAESNPIDLPHNPDDDSEDDETTLDTRQNKQ